MEPIDVRRTADFRREGWTPPGLHKAVKEGALERIRRSVYATVADLDAEAAYLRRIAAACQCWSSSAAVSHVSAAVIHGLPVRRNAFDLVHLTGPGASHGKVKAGVRWHNAPLSDDEVVVIGDLRVTSLERTVADLGRCEAYEWGVVAADAALRRQLDLGLMQEYVDHGQRKRGNGRLREVLAFADAGSESALESMSRVSIARAGLPKPELQKQIIDPETGEWVATSDFAWGASRLVGEADGRGKYADDEDGRRTAADVVMTEKTRDQQIVRAGWTPTHWGWDLATNHLALGRHLRAFLRAAA